MSIFLVQISVDAKKSQIVENYLGHEEISEEKYNELKKFLKL